MQRRHILTLSFAAAVAATQLGAPRASAADMMSTAADCSKASAMMMKMPAMPAMDAKMTVDKEFALAMSAHNKAMMAAAKMESLCGKDPKVRAMAKKMMDSMMKEQPDLDELTRHSS